MTDIRELEERLRRLEDKSKYNFFEIERRLINLEGESPENLKHRVQYVEDLLLLMQVENEKIKQIISSRLSIPSDQQPIPVEIEERINRIEENMEKKTIVGTDNGILKRLDKLERFITEEVSGMDKRLINLEDHIFHNKREGKKDDKHVLNDVHKILKGEK